ncbi:MAG: hypothetical protein WBD40_06360 [Tepidisphaeraceae bacterium]
MEQLEARRLMAGTVHAVFADGVLHIFGDDQSNTVFLRRGPQPYGAVEVFGDDGTLINGVAQRGPFNFLEVRDINIQLNDGDDQIHLVGLRLLGGVTIDGGADDDQIFIRRSRLFGNVLLGDGRDGETLSIRDSFFGNDLVVYDKRGPSSISLRDSVFDDNLSITTGPENDRLTINNCVTYGFSGFATGKGDDFIRVAEGAEFRQPTALDDGEGEDEVYREVYQRFDFNRGEQGWRPHFADYDPAPGAPTDLTDVPVPKPESAATFRSEIAPLPPELKGERQGYRLFGTNRSDDLFVFLSRRLSRADGLLPNQRYQIVFSIKLATNNHPRALGPHEGLVVGSLSRPVEVRFLPDSGARLIGNDGRTRAQPAHGDATVVFEDIKKTDASLDRFLDYESITLVRTHKTGSSSAGANLWLFAGVDSGSEGDVEYYFERVEVRLLPVSSQEGAG